jgi:hypothetical protein
VGRTVRDTHRFTSVHSAVAGLAGPRHTIPGGRHYLISRARWIASLRAQRQKTDGQSG